MDDLFFSESLTSGEISATIGLVIGLIFGAFAQQSRFCLRAACVEFWRGQTSTKFAIWLLAFGAAMVSTQLFVELSWIDTGDIRQLNNAGSMSGAIVGGLLFGSGMILARGCASRLLVLSATGNIRTLVAGLVVTLVAQATYKGILSPVREEIASWWLTDSYSRGFSHWLPEYGGIILGILFLIAAYWFSRRYHVRSWWVISSLVTGLTISLAWLLTSLHSVNSFDIVPVTGISFTGPSADTLMGLINQPTLDYTFEIGLVPGVFLGSLIASILTRQFKWQQFTTESGTLRFLYGACMMGFGSMLAGGCAVGAGVTGGVMLVKTAWIALFCMWLGAGLTDYLVDRRLAQPRLSSPVQPNPS